MYMPSLLALSMPAVGVYGVFRNPVAPLWQGYHQHCIYGSQDTAG